MGERISIDEYNRAGKVKFHQLWWQIKGLSFTRTGYGRRIPTSYMVLHNGKWRRVYCCRCSNSGTCYIGKSISDGIIVD